MEHHNCNRQSKIVNESEYLNRNKCIHGKYVVKLSYKLIFFCHLWPSKMKKLSFCGVNLTSEKLSLKSLLRASCIWRWKKIMYCKTTYLFTQTWTLHVYVLKYYLIRCTIMTVLLHYENMFPYCLFYIRAEYTSNMNSVLYASDEY